MDRISTLAEQLQEVIIYSYELPEFISYLETTLNSFNISIETDSEFEDDTYLLLSKIYEDLCAFGRIEDFKINVTFHELLDLSTSIPSLEDHFNNTVPKVIEDINKRFTLKCNIIADKISKLMRQEGLLDTY